MINSGINSLLVVVPFIGTQSIDIYTSVGPPTTLSIEVGGKPLPEVQWFKDDNPTVHRMLADGSLYIEKTSVSDAGTYTARVTNAAGKSEESIHVTVVEPSPPEGNNYWIMPQAYIYSDMSEQSKFCPDIL